MSYNVHINVILLSTVTVGEHSFTFRGCTWDPTPLETCEVPIRGTGRILNVGDRALVHWVCHCRDADGCNGGCIMNASLIAVAIVATITVLTSM